MEKGCPSPGAKARFVKDFHVTYLRLIEKGVQFLGEILVEIRSGAFVAYFKGVEHEICEMREIT